MSTTPSKDQQIDALWAALQSSEYWFSSRYDGHPGEPDTINIDMIENNDGQTGRIMNRLLGPTREDVIAQLIAIQTAERLA